MPHRRNALVITDGAAGNVRQATALASAMGLDATVTTVSWPAPWSWLAPKVAAGAFAALPPALREHAASGRFAIAIGCGRAAALATRVLRERSGMVGVQILDPRASTAHWDIIVAPLHDELAGPNVITTLGSLNPIDDGVLAAAAASAPALAETPSPRTLLVVGGSNRAQRIDRGYVDALFAGLPQDGALFATLSRRTDRALVPIVAAHVAARGGRLYDPASDEINPYLAFLAHADRIVVTPDSVNLLSEACATGKPVYTFSTQPIAGKLARFHAALRDADQLRSLDRIGEAWSPLPLRETAAVAAEVWARIAVRLRD